MVPQGPYCAAKCTANKPDIRYFYQQVVSFLSSFSSLLRMKIRQERSLNPNSIRQKMRRAAVSQKTYLLSNLKLDFFVEPAFHLTVSTTANMHFDKSVNFFNNS